MHLPVRLRVPLAGLTLCSTALLVSACGGSSGSDRQGAPSTAVAVVGARDRSRRRSSTTLHGAGLRAVQGRQEGLPQAGHGGAQAAAAELRGAARAAGRVRRGRQAAQGHREAGRRDEEPAEARAAVRQGHQRQGRRREVEEGPRGQPHERGPVVENLRRRAPAPGDLREADQERHRQRRRRARPTTPRTRRVLHARQPRRSATSWSRTRPPPTRSTRSSPPATRSSPRWRRSTRSTRARRRAAASSAAIQKGQTVPVFDKVAFSIKTGQVAPPVKSSYGWHVIEATADTVPATAAAAQRGAQEDDPRHAADAEEAERRQQVVHRLPEEAREERALRGRHAPAKTTSTAATTAAPATTTG